MDKIKEIYNHFGELAIDRLGRILEEEEIKFGKKLYYSCYSSAYNDGEAPSPLSLHIVTKKKDWYQHDKVDEVQWLSEKVAYDFLRVNYDEQYYFTYEIKDGKYTLIEVKKLQ